MKKQRAPVSLEIAEFTIEYYERVLALWQKCDGVGIGRSDTKENIALFLSRNPGTSFVAKQDSDIVGAVLSGHDGRRGYIHHLAVLPAQRRRGIGRLLIDESLEKLADNGILKCHIMVFGKNTPAREFWDSMGWTYRDDINLFSKFLRG